MKGEIFKSQFSISMIFFDILSSLNRYFTGKEEIHAEVNIFVRFGDSIFRNVKI